MRKSITEIADIVNGQIVGNHDIVITGLCGIKEAKEGDLTFLANSKYAPLLEKTKASVILTERNIQTPQKTLIYTDNPSLAFAKIASYFVDCETPKAKGIHPSAVLADDVQIGQNVVIGPCVVIENKACIGDDTIIQAGCFIGPETTIGEKCLIYPNTTIRERITIGKRVIIHSGTVIGSDGFGFVNIAGVHEKIPQIGTVVIEDDVEIGANVTIDRARFDKTLIGRGTKIDNLVQIAHNVHIGENCIIVAQVGISGSTTVEKNAILAGQVGVVGHLTIGEGAIIAAQSGVSKSVPPHTKVFGSPAKPHALALRINACVKRLPEYVDTIMVLKKKVEALESQISKIKKDS
ncbi:MAG: UDP-3-O-(3-hydroxymyristoyl)glucosamine N-acyltransferase [Candidatus Omnitrophota bacterium]